jgi:hypothetical protein
MLISQICRFQKLEKDHLGGGGAIILFGSKIRHVKIGPAGAF